MATWAEGTRLVGAVDPADYFGSRTTEWKTLIFFFKLGNTRFVPMSLVDAVVPVQVSNPEYYWGN